MKKNTRLLVLLCLRNRTHYRLYTDDDDGEKTKYIYINSLVFFLLSVSTLCEHDAFDSNAQTKLWNYLLAQCGVCRWNIVCIEIVYSFLFSFRDCVLLSSMGWRACEESEAQQRQLTDRLRYYTAAHCVSMCGGMILERSEKKRQQQHAAAAAKLERQHSHAHDVLRTTMEVCFKCYSFFLVLLFLFLYICCCRLSMLSLAPFATRASTNRFSW